jgi:hypothetical protein
MNRKINKDEADFEETVGLQELSIEELTVHVLQAPLIAAINEALAEEHSPEEAVNLRMARHLLSWNESFTIH